MLDSTRSAAVDRLYHWIPIDDKTPVGTKLQLIRKDAGAAYYGPYRKGDTFPTHYCPLPTFEKTEPLGPAEKYILNEMLRNTEIKYDPVRGHRI